MNLQNYPRIWASNSRMNGVPCVRGTSITVYAVGELLNQGKDRKEIIDQYPVLSSMDISIVEDFLTDPDIKD